MNFIRLSMNLLRVHRALYLACGITVLLTTIVVASQVGLVVAFSDHSSVTVVGLSTEDVRWQLSGIRGILITLSTLTIIISFFLMWSSIGSVVNQRLKESSLLRLVGASRRQLARISFFETMFLALIVSLPGSLLGLLVSPLLFQFLQLIGFFGAGVDVAFGFPFLIGILIGIIVAIVAAVSGAIATASSLPRDLEVSPATGIVHRSTILGTTLRVAIVLGSIALVMSIDPATGNPWLVLLTPFFAVVPLVAAAPLIIPIGAKIVGSFVGFVFPGPGRLASQRAIRDRLRFAKMGIPTIVCVGILGGFLVANAPDQIMRNARNKEKILANTVMIVENQSQGDKIYSKLADKGASVRLASQRLQVNNALKRTFFTDIHSIKDVVSISVREGSLEDVGGNRIASSLSAHKIGEELTIVGANGIETQVTVVATIDDPVYEGIFFEWSQLGVIGVDDNTHLPTTVFTSAQLYQTRNLTANLLTHSDKLFDRDQYVLHLNKVRAANTFRSNVGIFGTIYVMSVISLLQVSISSAYVRRKEFQALSAIGVSATATLAIVFVEAVIIHGVAGTLVSMAILLLGWQFSRANDTSLLSAIQDVSPIIGLAFLAVASVGVFSQCLGAYLTIKHNRLS